MIDSTEKRETTQAMLGMVIKNVDILMV